MKKKVLIIGGTGFLGVHLARRLLKENYDVTLFDIAPLDAKDLLGKVSVIKGDIRNKKSIGQALQNIDYVVHAAAALPIQRTKRAIFSVNVDGTRNVLAASLKQKIKRLVFISSTAVYGVPRHLPETENSPINPIGHYGKSKIEGEKLCRQFGLKGLSINIIRPKTFLGPERLGIFQLWFEAIYNGKKIFLLGSGHNPYQLLAVSDVVEAIYKALTTRVDNEIFNIGARDFETWRKDLGAVITSANSKTTIVSLPTLPSQMLLMIMENLHLSPIAAWHYKTLPVPSYVSSENAEKKLHWQAQKSNRQLLIESYQWYEKNREKIIGKKGQTHRVGWNFQVLSLIEKFF